MKISKFNKLKNKILKQCNNGLGVNKSLNISKVEKALEKIRLLIEPEIEDKSSFSNKCGISADKSLIINLDICKIHMLMNNGFSMDFIFNKRFTKKNVKNATVLAELTDNILEIEIEIEDKFGEIETLSHKVGFEEKELLSLDKSVLINHSKKIISITLSELPF